MTDRKKLSRSEMTIVNLMTSALAWGWPVLLAFVATPLIVRGLGNDAYGIRSLVVSITGYFALLDLGLNGAVTKYLAEYHVKDDTSQMTELLGTTLTTYAVFGLVGGALIWILAEWFATNLFSIPPQFHQESILAFRLTGIGFFLSMITWWGSSIPTGIQRFDVFNGISIGFGTLTTLGNLAAVLLGYGLIGVVWSNLFSNVIAIIAYWIAARRLLPGIPLHFSFDWSMFKRTVLFGMYMVAFRIFGLLFAQLDILLIGSWIGTAAITFYTVPQQVAQMVQGLNSKVMQVVFPMASEFTAVQAQEKLHTLFYSGAKLSIVLGMAVVVPLISLAQPLLQFWVSPELALNSGAVLILLVTAFFLNGLTAMPSSILMGMGYPQLPTLGALVIGLASMVCNVLFVPFWGINGAALAKVTSVIITIIFYLVVCRRFIGISLRTVGHIALKPVLIGIVLAGTIWLLLSKQIENLLEVLLVIVLSVCIYSVLCWWFGVFNSAELEAPKKLLQLLMAKLAKSVKAAP